MARNEQGELTTIWTPANVITSVRICFIPVFMLLAVLSRDAMGTLTHPAFAIGACVLYILLSLTDKLDGSLARKRNEITDFGKFLDPIADKLLVFSALLLLLDQGYVNVWVVFIILLREFLVSALRMVASAAGEVIAADSLGKAKTAVTMVSLCGFYVAFALEALGMGDLAVWILGISQALMVAAVVLTVVSGIQYIWNARDIVFRV